jgi:hypothetical protein
MRFLFTIIILFIVTFSGRAHEGIKEIPASGYEQRIRDFIDSLKIIDTHEHMFNPEALKNTHFLDFTLLLQQNSYDDLISAGMPNSVYDQIFNRPLSPTEKWRLIEPFWKNSFNTTSNRVILLAIRDLYGITQLNDSTVELLSSKIKSAYNGDWFNYVLKDRCRIDNVIQEQDFIGDKSEYVSYSDRFSDWLTIRSKYRIDSLAVLQLEPIYTLDDFVKSMRLSFEEALKMGMVCVKINIAYERTLSFDHATEESARKVFRSLINGNEAFSVSPGEAKPLQDYMLHQMLEMAREFKLPVAVHTGIQAGSGNILGNSDPAKLTNLFFEYPDIKFVLYHGSYPYGGTLSSLVKTFKNVYLDMNWTYALSPSYAERYLSEWLETVPVSKIMAFGGDQRCVENTYGQLILAKQIISNVLIAKVKNGYFTESEAKTVAGMILHDNGEKFYNLK